MLSKMYLTNFLSFKRRTEFDFTASKYCILKQTNVNAKGILKGALFIGPNASGKTNALKALSLIVRLVKGEGDIPIVRYKCNFSDNPIITIEYEFAFDERIVNYVIDFNVNTRTIHENLKIDGQTVLLRNGNTGELRIGQNVTTDNQLDGNTIFLRTASFNTGRFPQEPTLRKLMDYLNNSYIIDGYNMSATMAQTITKYAADNGITKINQYLDSFGYDFFVEYGSESEGAGLKISVGSEDKVVFLKRKDYPVPNIIYYESQGNQVFTNILPYLIQVIEAPGMLIIDEFGNSLHNKLAEKVIRYFMEKAGDSQFFITSQHTNLVSNSLFRPDQIYLTTFQGIMGSMATRLSQFKPREAQNLEKMYLGGMFEGLPIYEALQN